MEFKQFLLSDRDLALIERLMRLALDNDNPHEADTARQTVRTFVARIRAEKEFAMPAKPRPSKSEDLLPPGFIDRRRFERWLSENGLEQCDDANQRWGEDICLGCHERLTARREPFVQPENPRGYLYKSDICGATHAHCAVEFYDRWREARDAEEPGSWAPPGDDIPF